MSYQRGVLVTSNPSDYRHVLLPITQNMTAAISQADDGTLLFVAPGNYTISENLSINKRIGLSGYEGRPVIYAPDTRFNLIGGASVVLDGVTLRSGNIQGYNSAIRVWPPNATLYANRTLFAVESQSYHYALSGVGDYDFTDHTLHFQHCTLERGYATITGLNLRNIALSKCYTPNYSTGIKTGTLFEDDKSLIQADGYGHEFGSPLIVASNYLVEISSRVLDLRGLSAPRVVLFDWHAPELFAIPSIHSADGHWSGALAFKGGQFGIYYLSSDARCPPIIHGPYTAE
jgi:hypothetical protein